MKILSFVGGHEDNIFKNCKYDPKIRKFKPGTLLVTIPYSGRMLNSHSIYSEEKIEYDGLYLPVRTKEKVITVDPLPEENECDYCVVSNRFAAACSTLGLDTHRLLTVADSVVDEKGNVIGCTGLCLYDDI